ncbi:protein phosphatase 2C domain-containing protein [Actinospica durhamensis]|uniref:Protein phosphatase 2C domain-containing protein n=1 Tax=Actinospica durhamensis TaxID=1508375 RepID=A0A941ESU8_9ACTN|nr:protein phosphatase 2C domain-containing protein [Actinospica durhamensis]MBR7836406.1 protein phosphatase 2C domain-containing protein [Actinospica durhamensis]
MSLSLRYAARSHVGLIRDGNEDSGYASARLLVIADGMGGQAAGEIASAVAVETLAELDSPHTTGLTGDPVRDLDERVKLANTKIRGIIAQNPELEGMGTTVTALFLAGGNHLAFAHIGDSRAYRLRGGLLEQISTDHTWVQRLIDEGQITEDEAGRHPQRSLLMRALGTSGEVDLDLTVLDLQAGDRFLLCSDGLSGFVPFSTLASTLSGYGDPHHAAETLIQHALRGGGADNITCIVADAYEQQAPGAHSSSQAETQYLELPVVVGAAAENQGSGLPSFSTGSRPVAGGTDPNVTGMIQTVSASAAAAPAPAAAPTEPGVSDTAELEAVDAASEAGAGGRKRRRWVKPTAIAGTCVIVLGAVAGGGYYWAQQQYYVGTDANGHVAIYQGVNMSLAGLKLSHVYVSEPVTVAGLPAAQQAKVRASITTNSLSDAQAIVSTLSIMENDCAALTAVVPTTTAAAPSLSPSPSATTPTAHASDKASDTASPKANASTGHATNSAGDTSSSLSPSATPSASADPSASLSSGITGLHQLSAQCPSNAGASGGSGTS